MARTASDNKAFKKLLGHAQALSSDLKRFDFFAGTEQGARFQALKEEALALLDKKILPELSSSLEMPLFVAVLGGTNTGKSTVFNALAGVLLSETKITAGATKHPLVYVHERWREQLLSGRVFGGIRCSLLESSGQTIVASEEAQMFFAFHQRDELESTAFIDSPDFDSAEPRNRQVAHQVLTQADVCVFLTTPQKYKDRVLVEDLEAIARQRKKVVVFFNFTEDELQHRTMVEDMRQRLDRGVEYGGFMPTVDMRYPERELEERVRDLVGRFLDGCPREEIKLATLKEGLQSLVERVRGLVESYHAEAGRKDEVLELVQLQVARALEGYRQTFALGFPELGEALRRRLSALELRTLLPPRRPQTETPRVLGIVVHSLGLGGDRFSRLFVDSLVTDKAPASWESFWQSRHERDLDKARQLAQLLRSRVDNHLRASAATSALSLALLREFFTVESLERFDADIAASYEALLAEQPEVGRALLERVKDPRQQEASSGKGLAIMANSVKLVTGIGLAYATAGFGVWDLMFLPLGFLGGSYGISLASFGALKRQRTLFREQRERWFGSVLAEVFIDPLIQKVESVASERDLQSLVERCDAIEREEL